MSSVFPPDDPDDPLDKWEFVTDRDTWLDGFEPVGERPPRISLVAVLTDCATPAVTAEDLVWALVSALRRELPNNPIGIIGILAELDLYEAWRAHPVCLSCGQPGLFASPPRDEDDNLCIVCRRSRERAPEKGWAALTARLEWLMTPAGRRAARARIKSDAKVGLGLFPRVSGPDAQEIPPHWADIVRRAEEIRRKNHLPWAWIARRLNVPERTLRYYRAEVANRAKWGSSST